MDTETHEARKTGLGKKAIALLVAVCVVAAGAGWYFLYFTKTPEYSLGLIQQALQKHDVAAFNKHVDVEGALSRGFDDVIAYAVEKDTNLDDAQKKMALGFATLMKGALVSNLKESVARYVETGSWDEASDGQAEKQVDAGQFADQAGLKDSAYRGVAYTKQEGATALVGIKLFSEKEKREMVLDLRLRKLDDGTWQVAELENLKKLLEEAQREQ